MHSEPTMKPSRSKRPLPLPPAVINDPLLTPAEFAAARRQAISTLWLHVQKGIVPKPIYVGPKSPRFRQSWLVPQAQVAA
jgi:predicted DNA-binding transcriptional regulator AlpA